MPSRQNLLLNLGQSLSILLLRSLENKSRDFHLMYHLNLWFQEPLLASQEQESELSVKCHTEALAAIYLITTHI